MFRPCIDLHQGQVKQVVGGGFGEGEEAPPTNFVADRPASWFASRYREDGLTGGHVIRLGPGNDEAARGALEAYQGGLQLGGGVTLDNATEWLDAGASHVIVTSAVFRDGQIDESALAKFRSLVGPERLVLDLSCRERDGAFWIVTDRWRRFTKERLTEGLLVRLAESCAEFLVHAVDVEGLCRGVERRVVEMMASGSPIPATYAGGAQSMSDLEWVTEVSAGRVDLTIGSALDLFGGTGVRYEDAVAFNRKCLGAS